MLSAHFLVLACVASIVHAIDPVVQLDYSTYQGTALPNGVSQWLGVRYAAPPLGQLRFAAPQDPVQNGTVQLADQHGLICLATLASPTDNTTSEDCLYLDVYAPSNATAGDLPVFFFVQGGGFNANSNPNLNGTGLIEASGMNIVVVNFNYRVGPYGFLAGKEVEEGGSLNNGLKDQIKALEWVQKYISLFGGDPTHVTLGGDSAGAASVSLLLSAYGGTLTGLFQAAAAESVSFATVSTSKQSQFAYDNLVIRTECLNSTDTLACLRSLSAEAMQEQNINTPFPGASAPPLYMYGPTLDYDLVPDYTSPLFAQGRFLKIPTIMGDDVNGGTIFTPNTTNNISESNTFLRNQFPALTLPQLTQLNILYPVEGTPVFPDSGLYWRQVSNVYGDLRYKCPGEFICSMYQTHGVRDSWNYLWNVTDPTQAAEGFGVPHTVEVNAIWGPTNVNGTVPLSYYPNGTNANIVPVVQAYWTSFIRSYNPNTYRLAGSPLWGNWDDWGRNRIVFQTNATAMQPVSLTERMNCDYINSIAASIAQ